MPFLNTDDRYLITPGLENDLFGCLESTWRTQAEIPLAGPLRQPLDFDKCKFGLYLMSYTMRGIYLSHQISTYTSICGDKIHSAG